MKTKHLLSLMCIVVFISLIGCKTDADLKDLYNSKTDYQYLYHRQGDLIAMGDSGDGYYFLNGTRIYYADKDNMNPVLLDNRPDADYSQQSGSNKNDNSFTDGEFLTFYNDKLYILERGELIFLENNQTKEPINLIEMSKDGSKRKTILTLDFRPLSISIHRGVIYYTSRDFSKDSDLEYYIMKYDLKKRFFNEPEVIYTGNNFDGQIIDLIPYGNSVYFLESGINIFRLMRYDIENENVTRLITEDDNLWPNIQAILNNKLIINIFDRDDNYEKKWISYICDLDGSNMEEFPIDINFISHIYCDNTYFFVRPVYAHLNNEKYKHIPDEMVIYDLDYQIVDTVDMSYYRGLHKLVAGDDEYMFIFYMKDHVSYIDYLDKKEIGNGNLEFKNLMKY